MKANKRIRDPRRRSARRLVALVDGCVRGTTTFPEKGNGVREEPR